MYGQVGWGCGFGECGVDEFNLLGVVFSQCGLINFAEEGQYGRYYASLSAW